MADISFHHGTRVFESSDTPVLIRTAQSAVVAIFGTAPDADLSVFPTDKPILIKGPVDLSLLKSLGDTGTLKDHVDGIMDQVGTYTYLVNIEEGADWAETLSNMVGDAINLTGVHALKKCEALYGRNLKPRLVCAPGFTHTLASDGVASINVTIGGSGYSDNPVVTIAGDGAGAEATAIVQDGAIASIAITKPGFGYTSATVTIADATGSGATATAAIGTTTNPVRAELYGILDELRAVAYVDGPSTSDEAAVLDRETTNSQRIYICDPRVLVWDDELDANVPQFASARFAGVQARVDRELGFNHSVSNKQINGITGLERPTRYGLQTDYLNENHVNTVINTGEGFVTWGNRGATGDDIWKFLNVRRTADFINEAIEAAYMEFVDKLNKPANLKLMVESGMAFMRVLEAEEYIVRGSGKVWIDQERNTPTEMAQGRVTLGVQFEPYAPMEDIRFIAHRNVASYQVMLDGVLREINDGVLALAA